MQVIDDDNLSRRCNLSLVLNSLLLDRDLTATWGKLHHVRGKFASGNNSVEVSLQAGRKNSELFRRIGWSSFVLLSEFLIQSERLGKIVVDKIMHKLELEKLDQ